jgi:hypothetical protein
MKDIINIDSIKKQLAAGSFGFVAWMELTKRMIEGILSIHRFMSKSSRVVETNAKWAILRMRIEDASPAEHPKLLCAVLEMILDRVSVVSTLYVVSCICSD